MQRAYGELRRNGERPRCKLLMVVGMKPTPDAPVAGSEVFGCARVVWPLVVRVGVEAFQKAPYGPPRWNRRTCTEKRTGSFRRPQRPTPRSPDSRWDGKPS